MLRLSGFEQYSRWVPLNVKDRKANRKHSKGFFFSEKGDRGAPGKWWGGGGWGESIAFSEKIKTYRDTKRKLSYRVKAGEAYPPRFYK